MHGKATTVRHDGTGIFAGLPDDVRGRPLPLARRDVDPGGARGVGDWAPDGEVMAVRHRELPVDGVQFHPESVLTPLGRELAKNFLEGA